MCDQGHKGKIRAVHHGLCQEVTYFYLQISDQKRHLYFLTLIQFSPDVVFGKRRGCPSLNTDVSKLSQLTKCTEWACSGSSMKHGCEFPCCWWQASTPIQVKPATHMYFEEESSLKNLKKINSKIQKSSLFKYI